jgi:hypothetical protein
VCVCVCVCARARLIYISSTLLPPKEDTKKKREGNLSKDAVQN